MELKEQREKKILEIAKYIISNKATIQMAADKFGISTSSVKKYINDDKNLKSIDYSAYVAVKETQKDLIKTGNYVGGKNGIRTSSISDFEAEEIARTMIQKGWTLEQASIFYQIPSSTIYDNLMRLKDSELLNDLKRLFKENKNVNQGDIDPYASQSITK